MKNFRTLLAELAENSPKEVTFTFGRFQGLTIGHEKLLDSIFKQPGDHYVFISQSIGDEKNPLSPEAKKKLLISAYPENKKAFSIEFRTPFEALGFLVDKGYSRIKMIVGEDRVDTFKQSFSGNTFPVEVKSAGDRSESGNKVEQSAGNILRDLARAGQLKEFQAAAMTKLSADQKIDMFNQIRKAHGKAPVKVSVAEKIREDYVSGKIFNIGDIVTEGSNSFKIIDRGSNYVRVTNVEGKVSRKWLTDIQTKRTVDKTFAEAYKPLDESSFSCNGYTPVFPNKAPVAAFRASAGHCDQYALLEAIKATETMYASKDLKSLYESYNRSGDFLAKLGDIESHTYRKEFQNLIAKRLLENISSVSEVFAHDKEKIANFFADVVGVNKNLTVESTIQRCVNKINNTQLSESQKKIYVELIDCLIAEGFEFDFYNLNFIRECSVTEGSDRDLLIYADSIIESLTFEDLVSDYSEENFVILKEAFGKKSVKIEEPLSDKKIQQRAKQIALQYMKQRKSRKAVDRLTTAERKKIEEIVNKKGSVLTMISKKLGKKIKKIESERLLPKEEPEIVKPEFFGIHYGNTPNLKSLSGDKWGSGAKGAEKERVLNSSDKRLRKRIYFYLQQNPNSLPKPETEVIGSEVYRARLDNIYDATNDPEGIIKNRKPNTDLETAILDAGYDGYLNRDFLNGAIVVLGKDSIDVDYLGTRHDAQKKIGPIGEVGREAKNSEPEKPNITSFRKTSDGFESGLLSGDQSLFLIMNKKEMAEKFPSYDMRSGRAFFSDESEKEEFIKWYNSKV